MSGISIIFNNKKNLYFYYKTQIKSYFLKNHTLSGYIV